MQHAAVEEQTDALTGWLESIGMEKYVNTFLEAGYELETILEVGLTDEDMDFLQVGGWLCGCRATCVPPFA